jgi:hypothetical protein
VDLDNSLTLANHVLLMQQRRAQGTNTLPAFSAHKHIVVDCTLKLFVVVHPHQQVGVLFHNSNENAYMGCILHLA